MVFNSWTFALFFLVFYVLYERLKGNSKKTLLLVASYAFYGAWDVRFLLLIAFSTLVDFYIGQKVAESADKKAKRFIALSLFVNLGILAYFKYAGFFVDSAKSLLASIGFQNNWGTLEIILPVGISFYTFQTLSYSIDIYRKKLQPTYYFIDFACFVAFFPQLVAGPIERAKDLLPKIADLKSPTQKLIDSAIFLILIGLFKKIVIADGCAGFVDYCFNNPDESPFNPLLATVFFAFQIYADFSGYTDMARGLARLLGVELTINFLKPYLVGDPSAFWRNWHISLSSWLRDYLYIPLGGNRKGELRTYINLFVTMVLGGLWHGAGWAFILWGAFHGLWLGIHRFLSPRFTLLRKKLGAVYKMSAIMITFLLTLVGWFLFRIGSVNTGDQMKTIELLSEKLFRWSSNDSALFMPILLFGGLVILLQWLSPFYDLIHKFSYWKRSLIYTVLIFSMFLFSKIGGAQFIYFQF